MSLQKIIAAFLYLTKVRRFLRQILIEFETPTKGGQKSAALSKCKVIQKSYNTGWKKYKKEDAETE